MKNPTQSVTVVTKTVEETAGSTPARLSPRGTRIAGATFSGAALTGADLSGARFGGGNLGLSQAMLNQARADAKTVPPQGLKPPPVCPRDRDAAPSGAP